MKNSSQTQHHRSETKKKEEQKMGEIAGCRLEAGTVAAGSRNSEFRYGIAKNFVIPAKFLLCHIFDLIAKIRYHSENLLS